MVEWCMAHPWMTFWIVFVALFVIEGTVTNNCRVCNNIIRMRIYEKTGLIAELDDVEERDGRAC